MPNKKPEKVNKNLYLPTFVADELDAEGELYGGPGAVAAAAIYHFCHLGKGEKAKILMMFRENEIRAAYQIVDDAEADAKKQKQTQ